MSFPGRAGVQGLVELQSQKWFAFAPRCVPRLRPSPNPSDRTGTLIPGGQSMGIGPGEEVDTRSQRIVLHPVRGPGYHLLALGKNNSLPSIL